MKKLQKNLFLGIVIIAASITGYFLQKNEQRSYVLEMETNADETFPAVTVPENQTAQNSIENHNDKEPGNSNDSEFGKININTASKEELENLTGIGEIKSERIIQYRETHGNFEVIEDIMKVDGIGRKTFEKFKNNITVN